MPTLIMSTAWINFYPCIKVPVYISKSEYPPLRPNVEGLVDVTDKDKLQWEKSILISCILRDIRRAVNVSLPKDNSLAETRFLSMDAEDVICLAVTLR